MKKRSILKFAPMVLLALLGAGCGPDCEAQCEEEQKCAGSGLSDTDCASYCKKLDALNEKAGCGDQYDDLLRCTNNQDDVCKADACESESKAYGDCQQNYCEDNGDECRSLTG